MRWTDTHCHLNHPELYAEWSAVLFRAQQSGLYRLFVIGYDLESSRRGVQLAEQSDALYAAVGIHPHDAVQCTRETLMELRELARSPRVAAIGEIGLDFYRDLSPREAQYQAFHAQMQLAAELGLPVVIHCREAYEELLDVLSEYPAVRGVLHCFAGSAEQAQRGLALGYFLGIGGVITFKSAESLRAIVRTMPRDRLLLETDAPYLAPHPYRGERNEPAYLPLIAQRVAELWGIALNALSEQTEANVRTLFTRLSD
ncbi:MAG: hydrolase TatD [Armatimonadetes bacterium JP3_11]|nr:MAG: hydrolase TatD [Armatimonadetes bacterium CP1_7O]OYT75398.1 MAG: hydrolase TatD [Armatimonadetes bacterium JP3_11]RMH07977.1 MAG: TatD family deoxyribonuclease [Armatimonadota bacterium]